MCGGEAVSDPSHPALRCLNLLSMALLEDLFLAACDVWWCVPISDLPRFLISLVSLFVVHPDTSLFDLASIVHYCVSTAYESSMWCVSLKAEFLLW